jgi:hypothetical protein
LSAKLDDETLVYDLERNEAHCLNLTVALVWQHCDGVMTAGQAARSLQSKLKVPVDTDCLVGDSKQLERFLYLVENSLNPPDVSRRNLILKYALSRWP